MGFGHEIASVGRASVLEDQPQYTVGIDPDPDSDSDPDTDGNQEQTDRNNRLQAAARPRLEWVMTHH
jgi:hypothetical protein